MINTMTNTNTNTAKQNDWKERELGAMWTRVSSSGNKYLSGVLTFKSDIKAGQPVQIVSYSNKDKKSDSQPDFRVYVSDSPKTTTGTVKPAAKSAPKAEVAAVATDDQELL